MNIPDSYEFTIDDFEKEVHEHGHRQEDAYVKLESVNHSNNMVYFKGTFSFIDYYTFINDIEYYELSDEYKHMMNVLLYTLDTSSNSNKEKISCGVQINALFTTTISAKKLIEVFNENREICGDDVENLEHKIENIFISSTYDENKTVQAIELTSKEFVDAYIQKARKNLVVAIDDMLDMDFDFLNFTDGKNCGLQFSEEFKRKFS